MKTVLPKQSIFLFFFFLQLPFPSEMQKSFSYREVNTNGLVVPVDFVRQVIKESHNRGLL